MKSVQPGGDGQGVEAVRRVDLPRYRFAPKENFERERHLALWSPSDTEGPTVYLNHDSPVLLEVVKYHQDRYPDAVAEDVAKVVMDVFGEVAVAKLAHSQKLSRLISTEQLDQEYRSEQALTIALMGLIAEESLIVQRLAQDLGRRRKAAA